jgi:hypothetical protein
MRNFNFKKVFILIGILAIDHSYAKNKVDKASTSVESSYPTDDDLKREEERFTEEQKETFKLFKEDYKKIVQTELKNRINENPEKKEELTRYYHEFYNTTLIDLMRNYRRDKIKIMKEWASPGITGASPSGEAGAWGSVFGFGLYAPWRRGSPSNDSLVGAGLGFGNPNKIVGGNLVVTADSIYKTRKNQQSLELGRIPDFDAGGVHIKIGRRLPILRTASVAVGASHVLSWGYAKIDKKLIGAKYISFTQQFKLRLPIYSFSQLQYTFGFGDKSYTEFNNFVTAGGGYAPFYGIGIRVLPAIGFAVDYVAKELHLTLNASPFEKFPATFSVGAQNVLWRNHSKFTLSFVGSLSYSFL